MTDTKALREVLGASPINKEPKAVETVESGNESTGVENLPQVRSESQDEDGETTVYLRGLRFAMVSLLCVQPFSRSPRNMATESSLR
jgi:hypothetical protein